MKTRLLFFTIVLSGFGVQTLLAQLPNPPACVPTPSSCTELVCNGGFELHDPILSTGGIGGVEFELWGSTSYVTSWHTVCAPPLTSPPCTNFTTPDLFVRGGSGGGIPSASPFVNAPNTWDFPASGNDAMAGLTILGSYLGMPWEETFENDLVATAVPGTFEISFYAYTDAYIYVPSTAPMYLELYLRNSSTNDLYFIKKVEVVNNGSAPALPGVNAGWVKVYHAFNLPAAYTGYDKLIIKASLTDLSGNPNGSQRYCFIDDVSLKTSSMAVSGVVTNGCVSGDGAIDITASNGTPPYTYSWTGPGGFTSASEDISSLPDGTYEVMVHDASGCLGLETFEIKASPVIYVDWTAPPGGDGSSWGNAFNDLQDALTKARTVCGDEIWVSEGTYYPGPLGSPNLFFLMADHVDVYGGFSTDPLKNHLTMPDRDWVNNPTILSGDLDNNGSSSQDTRIIMRYVNVAQATLDGFIVNYARQAGVILNGSDPEIRNCIFEDIRGANGAVRWQNSSPVFEDCTFRNNTNSFTAVGTNTASDYTRIENSYFLNNVGGIEYTEGNIDIQGCEFQGNTGTAVGLTGNAGTIVTMNIFDCLFEENTSASNGGAISISAYAQLSVTDCQFFRNHSTAIASSGNGGGAIFTTYGPTADWPRIERCYFEENTSASHGGAIFANVSTPVIINSIFFKNEANTSGGAITLHNYHYPVITSCTFTENTVGAGGSPDPFIATDATIFVRHGLGGISPDPALEISNSILWANNTTFSIGHEQGVLPGGMYGIFSPADVAYSVVEGSNGSGVSWDDGRGTDLGGNQDMDPVFVGGTDFRLKSVSPAIDKGDVAYIPAGVTKDFAGDQRVQAGKVDMGAYESDPSNPLRLKPGSETGTFSIVPNPTNGLFTITGLDEANETFIRVNNISGQVVFERNNFTGRQLQIDLEGFEAGLYFVTVSDRNNTAMLRLIRQ